MKETICILLPDLRLGGAEKVNLDLAYEFDNQGYNVEFLLMQAKGELLAQAQQHFLVKGFSCKRFRQVLWPLTRYLHEVQPNALLAAMWPLTGIAGIALRLSGSQTRLVVSEHTDLRHSASVEGLERRLLSFLGPWIYKPAHTVVGVSQGVCDSIAISARLDRDKLKVIYNPVRPKPKTNIIQSDIELMHWWQSGHKQLISVGSLKPAKDYPTLLKALCILRKQVDARLLILGEGNERKNLEKLIDELGLYNAVRIPGFRPDPYPYLMKADLFILSSAWEGLGNVIIEALTCGTPVVATDCPSGPAEILDYGKYGSLVPVRDERSLANAISRALRQPHDANLLMERAKNFTPEIASMKYLSSLIG